MPTGVRANADETGDDVEYVIKGACQSLRWEEALESPPLMDRQSSDAITWEEVW